MTVDEAPMHVTVIRADDWAGIYIDGTLWCEGHSISDYEWTLLLVRAGIQVTDLSERPESYEAIEAAGRCPATWPPEIA